MPSKNHANRQEPHDLQKIEGAEQDWKDKGERAQGNEKGLW